MRERVPEIRPGADGESLPDGVWVLRLALTALVSEGAGHAPKVSPVAFALSDMDCESSNPRLSVFAEDLTTPGQAWALLGRDPRYGFAIHLAVDAVRSLRPVPDSPAVPSLDVQWEPLLRTEPDGSALPDDRPGADGHAGIAGLMRGGAVNKLHTKSLRSQLADLATITLLDAYH